MPAPVIEPLLGTSHFRVRVGIREIGLCSVGRISSERDLDAITGKPRDHFATVVLRRALSRSTELYDWRMAVAAGKPDRRDVTIEQLDPAGDTVVNAWALVQAWPCRWSGPTFDALATDIACEELELAFDSVVWLPPAATPPATIETLPGPTTPGRAAGRVPTGKLPTRPTIQGD